MGGLKLRSLHRYLVTAFGLLRNNVHIHSSFQMDCISPTLYFITLLNVKLIDFIYLGTVHIDTERKEHLGKKKKGGKGNFYRWLQKKWGILYYKSQSHRFNLSRIKSARNDALQA